MERQTKTMDGNSAAAYVSYAFTEVAAIYPITPSSAMADETDKYSVNGKKNLFGKEVKVVEMQSEAGAAGAVHGSLTAGALTTTYTASQGLLLMIPNMYKMAGELLPSVIHVAARTIATHALSIFGDHSDIYACRQTGYAMLCANNPQEVMDLAAIAHLSAIKGRVPFLHFFDGFRTSHEIQKIKVWDYNDLAQMLDWRAVESFRERALSPNRPVLRGTAQNDDIFFQAREACNEYYNRIPNVVVDYMNQINARIGTNYKPFNYYGASDAETVVIAMGSVCDTIEETIDYLTARGEKVGLIKVRLYRPFVSEFLVNVLPKTVKKISVLDRTKEPGALGEPLYLDVLAALNEAQHGDIKVYRGRYGLASKDTTPKDIIAVYQNMKKSAPKTPFTIGIVDDVTNLSLETTEAPDTTPKGTHSCKFWGFGSDGTVGANKNSIKIIGDHTDMFVQGYFSYDSRKSGGLTISHLRFGDHPIKSTYYISRADFVACHNHSYVKKYDMLKDLKPGGKFLLNCPWSLDELEEQLSASMKKYIAENNIKFFIIDGIKIGGEVGLGGRINTILQAAFFKITNIIPEDDAVTYMKNAATNSYKGKGEKIVEMNHRAIEKGMSDVREVPVPASWKNLSDQNETYAPEIEIRPDLKKYVNEVLIPINNHKGNELPVSTFMPHVDGTFPQGSAAYEKRATAVEVPCWHPENCIECNICSYVCPHAVVRPAVLSEAELKNAPYQTKTKDMLGFKDQKFSIIISPQDCTGCRVCAQVCPGKNGQKALTMENIDTQRDQQEVFNYCEKLPPKADVLAKFKETTVKGSQFKKPLLEFNGACAGCGETPYAKLATQLFGDRMLIANATGCSSIWGGSVPTLPYTVNHEGKGPAWLNSLFEDNAEFGFGMTLAQNAIRERLVEYVEELATLTDDTILKGLCSDYLETLSNSGKSQLATQKLVEFLEETHNRTKNCNNNFSENLCLFYNNSSSGLEGLPNLENVQTDSTSYNNCKNCSNNFSEGLCSFYNNSSSGLEGLPNLENVQTDSTSYNNCKNSLENAAQLENNGKQSELSNANTRPIDGFHANLYNCDNKDTRIFTIIAKILKEKDFLSKKSIWMFGGDGWAYDIGFGGLDHVIASGENVNILVFDTEVYSNTGGQASKATPTGSIAQFAAGGKKTKKKDLASIAMSYGYVYVAQVAMGANYGQCIKAFVEAENYNGPSIIIAYAPCINHGIKGGLTFAQFEQKKAVESGYWNLFRFNPELKTQGKNPFVLDSKADTSKYQEFLKNEVRYNALTRSFPEKSEKLFEIAEINAKEKYDNLLNLAKKFED